MFASTTRVEYRANIRSTRRTHFSTYRSPDVSISRRSDPQTYRPPGNAIAEHLEERPPMPTSKLPTDRPPTEKSTPAKLTARQQEILEFIERQMRERGYPPSVREIGEAVGLTSPSTVHSHL